MYNGFINVLKPTGMTSNDVVGKLKSLARKNLDQKIKFGHTGTLDPNAAGVMLVCVERGTKFSQYVIEKNKRYIGTINLGKTTDTVDSYGKIEEQSIPKEKTIEEIEEVLKSFLGKSQQIPPKYSAIKINGQKLYDLARQGAQIPEIKSREIEITDLKLLEYKHPVIKIEVECSSGTYIRSLAQDIGQELGELAYLGLLVRTGVEKYKIEDSYTLEEIQNLMELDKFGECILDTSEILGKYPTLVIKDEAGKLYINGGRLTSKWIVEKNLFIGLRRVYNESGLFLGIGNLSENQEGKIILKSDTLLK